jgi:hypothetical protein
MLNKKKKRKKRKKKEKKRTKKMNEKKKERLKRIELEQRLPILLVCTTGIFFGREFSK